MRHWIIGASIGAALLSSPLAAEKRRDIRVGLGDIDLGTQAGMAELDRRIVRAAAKACGTAHHFDNEGQEDVDRCRSAAIERARAAMQAAAAHSGAAPGAAGALR